MYRQLSEILGLLLLFLVHAVLFHRLFAIVSVSVAALIILTLFHRTIDWLPFIYWLSITIASSRYARVVQ